MTNEQEMLSLDGKQEKEVKSSKVESKTTPVDASDSILDQSQVIEEQQTKLDAQAKQLSAMEKNMKALTTLVKGAGDANKVIENLTKQVKALQVENPATRAYVKKDLILSEAGGIIAKAKAEWIRARDAGELIDYPWKDVFNLNHASGIDIVIQYIRYLFLQGWQLKCINIILWI